MFISPTKSEQCLCDEQEKKTCLKLLFDLLAVFNRESGKLLLDDSEKGTFFSIRIPKLI